MIRFCFWNVNRRPRANVVVQLARENEIDVLLLAELASPAAQLLPALNAEQERLYSIPTAPRGRVQLLTRLPPDRVLPMGDYPGISITRLHPLVSPDFLLVGVHLSSKLHWNSDDQHVLASRLAERVEEAEGRVGHRRTVIAGDFNQNPYELGLVSSDALHAVQDRRMAMKEKRVVLSEACHYFYNPTWNLFGDDGDGAPGTYFSYQSTPSAAFWHVFDQVLLRPALVPALVPNSLRVVTRVGDATLMRPSGRPCRAAGSDHFPLAFALSLS